MDFAALALLVETATAPSLAQAARRLHIAPMRATRLIAGLEAELGVRLLHRSTRALSLTDEGLVFLPHARALVEAEAAALDSVRGANSGPTGTLRISASVAFGRKVVAPLAAAFMLRHPQLRVDLQLIDAAIDLVAEGYDLAIRIADLKDSELIARRIADNPRMLVAAPDYLSAYGRSRDAGRARTPRMLIAGGATHWTFDLADGGRHAAPVAGRFAANSIDAVHAACLGGLGIALLSEWDVHSGLGEGVLQEVAIPGARPAPLAIWAVYPSRRQVPLKVRTFIEALSERMRREV